MAHRINCVIRKCLGGILILFGLIALATEMPDGKTEVMISGVCFILAGLFLLFRKPKPMSDRIAKWAERRCHLAGTHLAGLHLAGGAPADLRFLENEIKIFCGGNTFSLPYSRITDLSIKTEAEIQKSYVSSAGGAVAGGMLFGPVGAMIGGRTKEKTTFKVEYFFIITYKKDGAPDYLVFKDVPYRRASKLIEETRPQWGVGECIEL